MHDSFTPLGGMAPMAHMMLGEISPGGVGVGLMGVLHFAILAVFIAGLMVGRTPEYLGKKIQAAEMKLVTLHPGDAVALLVFAVFWVTLLAVFGSVAVYVNRERHRILIPWVIAVIATVEMFFLFLMVVHDNPFNTFLTVTPTQGQGLNPLPAELLHGDSSADAAARLRRHDDPVCVRHGRAGDGQLDDSWFRAVRAGR